MIDDTRSVEAGEKLHPTFCLSRNVDIILKHTVTRAHANRWARNLRFLTLDDSDCNNQNRSKNAATAMTSSGGASICNDTEKVEEHFRTTGQCSPCEKRLPPPPGHLCEQHLPSNFTRFSSEDRETELRKFIDPCVHVREHTCHECQHVPLFPNQGRVTRFRVRRLLPVESDELPECCHFVAVSYCWTSQGDSDSQPEEEPYLVREENGTTRPIRAQRATIDRVVSFARENGFRMIWIDQECIEQDNPSEKELAIQAMDCVYLRAQISIGLFHAKLQQRHLDCLLLVYEHRFGRTTTQKRRGWRTFQGCRTYNRKTMWESVSMIAKDRWNTRAWILQEAFASSGNMMLLFPRADIKVNGWLMVCHELSQTDLAIRLDVVRECLGICMSHMWPALRWALTRRQDANNSQSHDPRTGQSGTFLRDREDIKTVMNRVNMFHPAAPDHPFGLGIGSTRTRHVCSAAVALTYLRLRDLFRVADKLAIVANLCGYVVRLNTTELEKSQQSLACCIFTLALANGDFSLLTPQIYLPVSSMQPVFPNFDGTEFSWAHSFTKQIGLADAKGWNPLGPTSTINSAAPIKLSDKGLSFPGFLWQMDEMIDLRHLQTKHAAAWCRLCHAKRPSSGRAIMLATTQILFETLEYLISKGHKRVANSILNSTSDHRWRSRDIISSADMIESVDQFPHGLKVENRQGMFSLQPSPDGRYYQCWIIDRIMEKGCIWVAKLVTDTHNGLVRVGQYAPPSNNKRPERSEAPISSDSKREDSRTVKSSGHTETTADPGLTSTAIVLDQVGRTESHETVEKREAEAFKLESHSSRMLMSLIATQAVDHGSLTDKDPSDFRQSLTSTMALTILTAKDMAQPLPPEKDDLGRRAIFDLDGSASDVVLVLTPLQMVLESIPRPAARSMSVSWVVEPKPGAPTDDHRVKKAYHVRSMVQGMWEFSLRPSGRYLIV